MFFGNVLILWDYWIFWILLEYYISTWGFFQFHQIALLCDHQELACTSKDPPRRVDMKDMSLIFLYKNIYWVIDKTVWKPTLVDPFENRKCALIFWVNELYELNVYLYLTLSYDHSCGTKEVTNKLLFENLYTNNTSPI